MAKSLNPNINKKITTRAGKGTPLTHTEMDANFAAVELALSSSAMTGSNVFHGDQRISGSIYLSGSIIPNVDSTLTSSYDLGSSTALWGTVYAKDASFESDTITMGGTTIKTSNDEFKVAASGVGEPAVKVGMSAANLIISGSTSSTPIIGAKKPNTSTPTKQDYKLTQVDRTYHLNGNTLTGWNHGVGMAMSGRKLNAYMIHGHFLSFGANTTKPAGIMITGSNSGGTSYGNTSVNAFPHENFSLTVEGTTTSTGSILAVGDFVVSSGSLGSTGGPSVNMAGRGSDVIVIRSANDDRPPATIDWGFDNRSGGAGNKPTFAVEQHNMVYASASKVMLNQLRLNGDGIDFEDFNVPPVPKQGEDWGGAKPHQHTSHIYQYSSKASGSYLHLSSSKYINVTSSEFNFAYDLYGGQSYLSKRFHPDLNTPIYGGTGMIDDPCYGGPCWMSLHMGISFGSGSVYDNVDNNTRHALGWGTGSTAWSQTPLFDVGAGHFYYSGSYTELGNFGIVSSDKQEYLSKMGWTLPDNDGNIIMFGTKKPRKFGGQQITTLSSPLVIMDGGTSGSLFSMSSSLGGRITGSLNISKGLTVVGDLIVRGDAEVRGHLTFGNSDTDSVAFGADISSSIIPNTHRLYDLGSSTKYWNNLYIDDIYFTGSAKGLYQNGTQRLSLGSTNTITGNVSASGWGRFTDVYLPNAGKLYTEGGGSINTYIQSDAADRVRIVVGGSQMMVWDQDDSRAVFGNGTKVYIGNNNNYIPTKELEISGDVSASGNILAGTISASGDITTEGTLYADYVSASYNITVGPDPSGSNDPYFLAKESATEFLKMGVESTMHDMQIGWYTTDDLHLGTLTSDLDTSIDTKMVIGADGDVGINTINPSAKLDVAGDTQFGSSVSLHEHRSMGTTHHTGSVNVQITGSGARINYLNLPTVDPKVTGSLFVTASTFFGIDANDGETYDILLVSRGSWNE